MQMLPNILAWKLGIDKKAKTFTLQKTQLLCRLNRGKSLIKDKIIQNINFLCLHFSSCSIYLFCTIDKHLRWNLCQNNKQVKASLPSKN